MASRAARITYADFPVESSLKGPGDCALALVVGTEGPAYRPVGAAMLIRDGRVVAGSLSSGCIESDIAIHAMHCLDTGEGRLLRYGAGSPYKDIRLPCGGGLDIAVVPRPDRTVLEQVAAAKHARRSVALSMKAGRLLIAGIDDRTETLRVLVEPDLAFHVFGKGPEAQNFTALTSSAGYDTRLYSPDAETRDAAARHGVPVHCLMAGRPPDNLTFDRFSAIVLFFHDHDWEPLILQLAAKSPAFYIGAQGSRRTRAARDLKLVELGVPPERVSAMKGPIGLVPHARDARTLAISVLSEIVAEASRVFAPATDPSSAEHTLDFVQQGS